MSGGGDGATVRPASVVRNTKPLAGPNGGNGGDGGSVVFVADRNATSLLDYRFMPHRVAGSGTMGLGDNKDGSKGEDPILPVPCGTVVLRRAANRAKPSIPGAQLADLRHEGDRCVVAQRRCRRPRQHRPWLTRLRRVPWLRPARRTR